MVIQTLATVWNPSEGFDLGFIMIRYYSLTWIAAFLCGWYLMKPIFIREKESIEKLDSLFIYVVLSTMLGARIGHVIFYQPELFTSDPLSIFLPIKTKPTLQFTGFSGLASHGAAIAIVLTMIYFCKKIMKRSLLWMLDRIVIPVSFGAIIIRIGNFFNSEIVGKPTESSLGIKFIHDFYNARQATEYTGINNVKQAYNAIATNPQYIELLNAVPAKHPAQLYEAFGYVFVFLIVLYLYWKTDVREKEGFLLGLFLVLLWGIRFIVEYVKESQGGFEEYGVFNLLSTGQWLSIPFVIIGFILIFKSKNNKLTDIN